MTDDRAGIIRLAEGYGISTTRWFCYCGKTDHCGLGCEAQPRDWNPFESHADAYELEAAIPEAKRKRYVIALHDAVSPDGIPLVGDAQTFAMIHATPRQRSEAALAVLEAR